LSIARYALVTVPTWKQFAHPRSVRFNLVTSSVVCCHVPVRTITAGATAKDEGTIAELAALSPLAYAKSRKEAAEAIGIGVGELDAIVAKARGEASVASRLPSRWEIGLWDEPVDGGALLTELRDTFAQHVVLPEHGAAAMALWTLHAWALDAADVSPFLVFSAPEMRCGKSTALALLCRTCPRTAFASNISPAAVFRYIEANRPTLIIDEADSFMHGNEELRGVLNSGHTRDTAFIIRCEGADHAPKEFGTWAPKAIALIGKPPGTIQDRAVVLPMKRKKPGERVTKLRGREDADHFPALRRKASRWNEDNLERLRTARPALPEALNDRAQDNWEPPRHCRLGRWRLAEGGARRSVDSQRRRRDRGLIAQHAIARRHQGGLRDGWDFPHDQRRVGGGADQGRDRKLGGVRQDRQATHSEEGRHHAQRLRHRADRQPEGIRAQRLP
jgi:putative DNA primase/helicase